jgi:spermidine/putrescine transport system substrate-binding protein
MPRDRMPTPFELALMRGLWRRRYSRRTFVKTGAALSVPALLVACGVPAQTPAPGTPAPGTPAPGTPAPGTPTPGTPAPGDTPTPEATPTEAPPLEGVLNFANWPFYIDQDEDTGASETLQQFEQETGVSVNYREVIETNDGFFGTIQPALAAGQDTGWDLIVPTDWMVARLVRLGYLEEINVDSEVANFVAHADEAYKDPWYDPGNRHSVPWQSGFTGIGYNRALTGRDITSFADLLDPEFSGRIGMFSEMRDSFNLAMLYLGINPETATFEEAQRAQEVLLEQAPLVRGYYGNEYAEALANGDLAVCMAWSGDVYQLQLDNPDLDFVIPSEGGNIWIDNLCIPRGAQNPTAAKAMMDFVYDPEIMAQICAYVQFISPVPAARDVMLQWADEAEDDEEREELLELADSELIFPGEATLAQVHGYPNLDDEEERRWQELFQEVVHG